MSGKIQVGLLFEGRFKGPVYDLSFHEYDGGCFGCFTAGDIKRSRSIYS